MVLKLLKTIKNSLPLQLCCVVLFAYIAGDFLNDSLKSILYAISLTLKSLLLFVLPVIISSCLFSCMLSFRDRALLFVITIFAAVCVSNLISTLIAYGVSSQTIELMSFQFPQTLSLHKELTPWWNFSLPTIISNEYALLLGLALGSIFSFYPWSPVEHLAEKLRNFVTFFLQKTFIPLLPVFALGFILKMQHDGILGTIIYTYTPIFILILATYVFYVGFLYGLAARFVPGQWLDYLKNVFPSGLMGFSTMSSIAALPVTLQAAEINTQNPLLARAIIPVTVNIHLVGDSIGIPIMAMAILLTFGHHIPTPEQYLMFVIFFVLSKFAVAAVPGGGILVMIPVLENYLGFSPEMSALITTLYILFDPIITATNVTGNGAFALLVAKCFKTRPQIKDTVICERN